MVGMIVSGHGNFATGLTSSVNLIIGQQDQYAAIDFVQGMSTDDLAKKMNEAIESLGCDGYIFFTDLTGGSPFRTAVEVSLSRRENIRVIGGTNLGMLTEISMVRTAIEDLDELVEIAMETGKDQIVKYVLKTREADEDSEDGI